ncbi:hypothetical protein, partial [Ureibacillus thermosphaericus]|uniref:hypothetical protein n=1 Tax=Ureibacillus thermosphaericus TaxID=51173 RepID=UPI001EE64F17
YREVRSIDMRRLNSGLQILDIKNAIFKNKKHQKTFVFTTLLLERRFYNHIEEYFSLYPCGFDRLHSTRVCHCLCVKNGAGFAHQHYRTFLLTRFSFFISSYNVLGA